VPAPNGNRVDVLASVVSRRSMTIDRRSWLLLVLLAILWGGSYFFNGVALRDLPPLTIVLVRVGLGAVFLVPLLKPLGGAWPKTARGWLPYLVMGLLNNVIPFSLVVTGQSYISSGLASVLNATTPLFSVLVLGVFGDERLSAYRIAGVVIGLIGVIVLRGPGLNGSGNQTLGMLLCLGGAVSYAISGLWARRMLAGVPAITSATCQTICSVVMMAVIAAAAERPWQLAMPGLPTWLSLAALGLLSHALAYVVFFHILARSGATNVMLVTLLVPVTAILLGYLVLGEPLSASEIFGTLIVGSALLVMDGRLLRLFFRPAPAGSGGEAAR
jgi:drug/metabolite transporter (DMT)-like permease